MRENGSVRHRQAGQAGQAARQCTECRSFIYDIDDNDERVYILTDCVIAIQIRCN